MLGERNTCDYNMIGNLVFWELGEDTRLEIIPSYTDGSTHHHSLASHVIVTSIGGKGLITTAFFGKKISIPVERFIQRFQSSIDYPGLGSLSEHTSAININTLLASIRNNGRIERTIILSILNM